MSRASIIALLTAACVTLPVAGQSESDDADVMLNDEASEIEEKAPWDAGMSVRVFGGYEYLLSTKLDTEGRFSVHRVRAGAVMRKALNSDLSMSIRLGGESEKWNFEGSTVMGRNPWDDVHTFGAAVGFEWQAGNDWVVFGGPVAEVAYEGGADIGDAFQGGGYVGTMTQINESLLIGGGFGIVSQIEDDATFYPVIVLDWSITDDLKLTSRTRAIGRGGMELVWSPDRDTEFAAGATIRNRRFLLNDAGFGQDGVVDHDSLTFYARVGWNMQPNLSLDLYAGYEVEGELTIDDSRGNRLTSEDYDEGIVLGVSLSYRF